MTAMYTTNVDAEGHLEQRSSIFVIRIIKKNFRCNKILCRYCLIEEINYCYCKNYCKRNQSVSVNQAKRMKNSCDQCLECPSCQTTLVKRVIDK